MNNLKNLETRLAAAKKSKDLFLIPLLEGAISKEKKRLEKTPLQLAKEENKELKKEGKTLIGEFESEQKFLFNRFNFYKKINVNYPRLNKVANTLQKFENDGFQVINLIGLINFNKAINCLETGAKFSGAQVFSLVVDYLSLTDKKRAEADEIAQKINAEFLSVKVASKVSFVNFQNICEIFNDKAKGRIFEISSLKYDPKRFENESLYSELQTLFTDKDGDKVGTKFSKYLLDTFGIHDKTAVLNILVNKEIPKGTILIDYLEAKREKLIKEAAKAAKEAKAAAAAKAAKEAKEAKEAAAAKAAAAATETA